MSIRPGLLDFFQDDYFANHLGIEIKEADHGISVCTLKTKQEHLNAGNVVQGGVIFTLADYAFAVAANSLGLLTVSLNNNITFLKPPKGEELTARAALVSKTRKTCLYEVTVEDDRGTQVAFMSVNGYCKETPLPFHDLK